VSDDRRPTPIGIGVRESERVALPMPAPRQRVERNSDKLVKRVGVILALFGAGSTGINTVSTVSVREAVLDSELRTQQAVAALRTEVAVLKATLDATTAAIAIRKQRQTEDDPPPRRRTDRRAQ